MIILSLFNIPAFAADLDYITETRNSFSGKINVEVEEYYDLCNSLLKKINSKRTKLNLNNLILDKELTESAIQLSIETSITNSYTRPNGKDCFSVGEQGDARAYFFIDTILNSSNEEYLINDFYDFLFNSNYYAEHKKYILDKQFKSIGLSIIKAEDAMPPTYDFGGQGAKYLLYICLGSRNPEKVSYSGKQSLIKILEFKNYDIFMECYPKKEILFLNNNVSDSSKTYVQTMLFGNLKIPYEFLEFTTKNESVVKISNEGKITAVGEGITNINISYNDGGISFSKKFEIQVIDALKCRHFFDYNNPVIKKKATCEDFGIYQYTCNICMLSIEEMIPKTGCLYTWKTIKEPTMFSKGLMECRCEHCSDLLKSHATGKVFLTNKNISIYVKNKSIKIKYKKVKEANGFQIRYKTKGKWKYVSVNKNKSITKTIKKLKKGKYSVQVRLFKNNSGNRTYTNWCKRKVKIK